MNAIEFVKQNGIGKAKQIIDLCPLSTLINIDGIGVSILDLKQIVDAFDLVEKRGGLAEAKAVEQQYWNSGVGSAMIISMELKQAIELVEKCNASDL